VQSDGRREGVRGKRREKNYLGAKQWSKDQVSLTKTSKSKQNKKWLKGAEESEGD
jgi:hypothetical protein